VLGEVEETIYTVDEEDEGGNGEVRTVKKQSEMLFVRGTFPPVTRNVRIPV
jgi:U6 snRNA-associated Sm-like protein LSm3